MSDVAETDQRFRVRPYEVEVERICDAIRTRTAACAHDGSDLRIGECIVEVGEAVLVAAGAEPVLIQRMWCHIDLEAPTFENCDRLAQPSDVRPARGRHETNDVTSLHDR